MNSIGHADVLRQLNWRYAVKKFDTSRTISNEDWNTLEQSLVLTPSSFGLQPWKFVVITDPAIKAKLPAISWGQKQVVEASHIVVFAIRKNLSESDIERFVERTAEVRGSAIESLAGFKKMLVGTLLKGSIDLNHWASLQVYIALGQFMTTAAVLGIDTCPMEGIDPAKYDELLGLNDIGFATSVACVAGYRAADDKYAFLPKVRFRSDDVIMKLEGK